MKVIFALCACVAGGYAQTASGTLSIGADQFTMKYAASTAVKEGTRIVVADKPIPEDLMDDESQIWDLKSKGYHGLQIDIGADKRSYTLFVISSTLEGSFTRSTAFDSDHLPAIDGKRVEGALEAAKEAAAGTTLAYSIKFAAPIMPAEAAPTAADQTAAATKESTKAYLAVVAAIRAGDKKKIMDLAPPDRRAVIDTPDFPKILKMVQEMTPTDIQVLKATETGDTAKLLARGKMDGATQRGKIYLTRINGRWIMKSETWAGQ